MAGLGICLYTDENIDPDLAEALHRRGLDAESCHAAGRAGLGIPDDDQLTHATDHGRAILTFNYTDYLILDTEWRAAGREHAGIIITRETRDLGTLLRRVERHLNTIPPDVQHNTLLWLDTSPIQ